VIARSANQVTAISLTAGELDVIGREDPIDTGIDGRSALGIGRSPAG
jgi:hypothetical protein